MTLSPEQVQFLAPMFAGMVEREMHTTRRVLAAMPEDQLDFKLGDKGRTARELMWHICTSEAWFGSAIVRGNFDQAEGEPAAPATAAEMLAWYDRTVPALVEQVKGLSAEHLARTAAFFGAFNMSLVLYLPFWNSHTIHHRGQLSTYVRAVNGHVPDIYGGSADEPFQMPAASA